MNGPSAAWKGLVLPVLALLLLRPTACAWTFHPFESLPEDLKTEIAGRISCELGNSLLIVTGEHGGEDLLADELPLRHDMWRGPEFILGFEVIRCEAWLNPHGTDARHVLRYLYPRPMVLYCSEQGSPFYRPFLILPDGLPKLRFVDRCEELDLSRVKLQNDWKMVFPGGSPADATNLSARAFARKYGLEDVVRRSLFRQKEGLVFHIRDMALPLLECRSTVHMSGTLEPLPLYASELDLFEPEMKCFPSPFPKENLKVCYVQDVSTKYDELNQSVQENVTGIRLVKAFVREDYENEKFARAAENLYKLYVKAEGLMAWNHPIMNMVVYGCIIALSWMGAHYIVDGTLTTGELTSLFTYIMSILMSLMMLSMVFVMLTQSAASAKRVAEIIEEEPDIVNPEHSVFEIADGSLAFRNVRFDYVTNKDRRSKVEGHKRSALFNINFNIQSGETIGIIGGTGSGKSTLISLISRLYDPTQGEVFVGGHNVKDYDLTALRHTVSVVLQQNILFSGSVLDNLRWGNPDATLEECRKACQMAQADDFVSAMPEGYDTHIEQGGTNVSGGQKQRLCIARALLKHPKILILDDSTSACDTATDAKIREAFHTQLPDMTKVIIAQRILSVKDCDRILVMDNGIVTGFDTHENLLKNNTLYQEINAIQNENVGDFDEVKGGAA